MSAGDKSIYLKAGQQGLPVRAAGDFIFLKDSARPVRVLVDGQPITMRAGDKRRVDRKEAGKQAFDSFEIDNLSDVDLKIVFVVGDGDFNSQVVTGELSLLESIKTTALGTDSLPVSIEKRIGLISSSAVSFVRGNDYAVYNGFVAGEGFIVCFGYFDGFIWSVSQKKIRCFTLQGSLLSTFDLPISLPDGDACGGCLDNNGFAFIRIENKIYKVSLYDGVYTLIKSGAAVFEPIGLALRDGRLYWFGSNNLYSCGVDGLNDLVVPVVGIPVNNMCAYDEARDVFLLNTAGNSNYWLLSASDFKFVGQEELTGLETVSGITILGKNNLAVVAKYSGLEFKVLNSVTYPAKLYAQNGDDLESRIEFYTGAAVTFFNRGADVIMSGEIIKVVMQGIMFDGALKNNNYLDYVTEVIYSDGRYQFQRSAGSASFAYKGYADNGHLLMGSDVSVKLLPEYLTDAL